MDSYDQFTFLVSEVSRLSHENGRLQAQRDSDFHDRNRAENDLRDTRQMLADLKYDLEALRSRHAGDVERLTKLANMPDAERQAMMDDNLKMIIREARADEKIRVIKAVRTITGWDLKRSKTFVDEAWVDLRSMRASRTS